MCLVMHSKVKFYFNLKLNHEQKFGPRLGQCFMFEKIAEYMGNTNLAIMSTIEFFTIHISVRLSDRSEDTQHIINFVKNCPQWDLSSQPQDHFTCWTLFISSPTCEVVHETKESSLQ